MGGRCSTRSYCCTLQNEWVTLGVAGGGDGCRGWISMWCFGVAVPVAGRWEAWRVDNLCAWSLPSCRCLLQTRDAPKNE